MAEEFESSELEETKKKKKERKKKENEIETAMGMDEYLYEKSGGGISTVIVTIAIIIIWLAVFAILVKWDVGNFGSTVLYPVLKDVPIINMILPEVEETQKEESGYGYATLAEAVAEIKRLEAELDASKTANSADDEVVQELSAEIERLKKFEENQVQFEKTKTKFYEDVIFADNAPDIENYKEYYELIEPDAAAELYKQVVQQISYDEQVEEYAKAYGEMKPAQAAGVFEAMTDDLELAAKILQNIDATQRGKILGAMDPEIAARITKIMEP